jgi:hypothetical protein
MFILLSFFTFLNELQKALIKPNAIITVETDKTIGGLKFKFMWIREHIYSLDYVVPYEEVQSVITEQIHIKHMIDYVNSELQKKFNDDLSKI